VISPFFFIVGHIFFNNSFLLPLSMKYSTKLFANG
jgi:hypothetical protein